MQGLKSGVPKSVSNFHSSTTSGALRGSLGISTMEPGEEPEKVKWLALYQAEASRALLPLDPVTGPRAHVSGRLEVN